LIETFGLAHVALKVKDVDRSFRFYQRLLGARLLGNLEGRDDENLSDLDVLEFGTPGSRDVIVVMRSGEPVSGDTGQLEHIGFRLVSPEDPATVAAAFEEAGGTVASQGHFSDGDPYVFGRDPDGYIIELWFQHEAAWRTEPRRNEDADGTRRPQRPGR
jgi:catechol 2,3-dioxygenase-like lactoylglutathione lyase family enzyme